MYDNFGMYTQRFCTLQLIEIGPLLSRKVIYSAGDSSNERKKKSRFFAKKAELLKTV